MAASVPGPRYSGWWQPAATVSSGVGRATTMEFYVNGTKVGAASSALLAVTGSITASTTMVATDAVTSNKTGNAFVAATGNVAIGNPGAFATTQPQGAVIMGGSSLSGVAPAGAITTAGAIFASDTVVRKIIAASTVSNVET